ncbi:MAG: TRAP transporter small permease [Spirochaetaceae bacterium]|jgi:TRAP-type C4-dicarboxylate transport system permease small subunit|nr:TRAP transporter small permease [Spirochaetaceae bacterium]
MQNKFLAKISGVDLIIAGTALSVLILYTFFGVIMRYFIKRPILWGEEFQLFCIIIVIFFGAGAGFRTGSHVAIDILVDFFPKRAQKVIALGVYCIGMGVIVYFCIQSAVFVRQMFVTKRTTDILNIPYYLTYSAFPIGCGLIMINYTLATYLKYLKPATPKEVSA